jgi:hypothetical protein
MCANGSRACSIPKTPQSDHDGSMIAAGSPGVGGIEAILRASGCSGEKFFLR